MLTASDVLDKEVEDALEWVKTVLQQPTEETRKFNWELLANIAEMRAIDLLEKRDTTSRWGWAQIAMLSRTYMKEAKIGPILSSESHDIQLRANLITAFGADIGSNILNPLYITEYFADLYNQRVQSVFGKFAKQPNSITNNDLLLLRHCRSIILRIKQVREIADISTDYDLEDLDGRANSIFTVTVARLIAERKSNA